MEAVHAADLIAACCETAESSLVPMPRPYWRERLGMPEMEALLDLGVLARVGTASSVACTACQLDHDCEIETDDVSGFRHYCPEAGWVSVAADDLVTLNFDPAAVIGMLVGKDARRVELIQDRVWMLGDIIAAGERCTLVYARRLQSVANIEQLANVLQKQMPATEGIVATSSGVTLVDMVLPHNYKLVPFETIVRQREGRLTLDEERLARWIASRRTIRRTAARSHGGRPKKTTAIKESIDQLVAAGMITDGMTKSAIAELIMEHWTEKFPTEAVPGKSTIMKTIPAREP